MIGLSFLDGATDAEGRDWLTLTNGREKLAWFAGLSCYADRQLTNFLSNFVRAVGLQARMRFQQGSRMRLAAGSALGQIVSRGV